MSKSKQIKQSKTGNRRKQKFNFLNIISSNKIAYIIILIFAVIVYSKSFTSGFVDFDDSNIIRNLDVAGNNINLMESFKRDAFLSTMGDVFYRPMQGLTYIIDYQISGNGPLSYHITNLLIHILTCIGLFYLLNLLRFDRGISFLFTLLFTVHPLFNQTVAWVPSRGDLLIGLFGTLSFITLIKYFEEKSWIYFTAHLAAFFVSMFSKETAILFPILFALIYYFRYYEKNVPKFFNLKNLLLISGWIIIIGFFLILRANIIKVAVKPEQFGISAFITNIWAMPEFITKFFIPIKLSGIPEFSFLISSIGILLMVGITVFSILNKKDFNYLSLIGLVWFIIFTATTMTFRHEHGKTAYDYLEHRSYLPSIGLIIFILSFIKDIKKVKLLIFCLIPLIFFYSVYSYKNIKKFENPLTFYNSVIDEGSNVALAYYNRGVNKQNSNDKQGAVEDYLKALSIKNDYAQAYNNKGNIERELKEYDIAIEDYTKAIKSKPDFAEAYSNRGVAYKEINRRDDAMTDYLKAIKINPLYPGSYNNIGVIYGTEANYPESIKYFSKAIDCDSKFGEAYKNRGLSYLFLDKRELACEDFKKGIEYGSDGGKDLYNKNCK